MGNVKEMQPLTTESGQVYVHEPCAGDMIPLMWTKAFGPLQPKCPCEQPGPWLKVYVEREVRQ